MKKWIPFVLSLPLILAGCASARLPQQPSLESLPVDYSLEQAKADGCVVFENIRVTSGQEIWDTFLKEVDTGHAATVRLGFYYTLDPAQCDPAYYESVKDQYPVLYIEELAFDGTRYTIRCLEDGQVRERTYQYLMKYEGEPESPNASYSSYTRYVLTNDQTVTWRDIEYGMFSSHFGDAIDHHLVYSNLI